LLKQLGRQLRDTANITLVFELTGSCTLTPNLYSVTPIAAGQVMEYILSTAEDGAWTTANAERTCTVSAATPPDLGISALCVEAGGFAKWMTELVVRSPAPTPTLAEALLQEGIGRAYGSQVLVRRPWHGLFGWIAYTISRSERRDAPGATWRLFDDDQPHVLTALATKELGPWSASARLRFATGLPRTPVTAAFFDARDDLYQPVFGDQNSARLPAFWQLDARIDRGFELGGDARVHLYVEGLNVTNHANAEEYVYNTSYTQRGTVTGLPFLAVVGARGEM
jgi:hypothetical protein